MIVVGRRCPAPALSAPASRIGAALEGTRPGSTLPACPGYAPMGTGTGFSPE